MKVPLDLIELGKLSPQDRCQPADKGLCRDTMLLANSGQVALALTYSERLGEVQPDHRRTSAPGMLRRSAGRSGTGAAESLLLRLALGRRCGEEAPHPQDHPGRTVSEATKPACTGVTGGVRAFLGQFTPALETGDERSDVRG